MEINHYLIWQTFKDIKFNLALFSSILAITYSLLIIQIIFKGIFPIDYTIIENVIIFTLGLSFSSFIIGLVNIFMEFKKKNRKGVILGILFLVLPTVSMISGLVLFSLD